MLTFLGPFIFVLMLPLELMDALAQLTTILTCEYLINRSKVEQTFDIALEKLTGLNPKQVEDIIA
jgi:hypothetical protein